MLWSTFLGVKSASLESHEDLSSRLDGLQYRRTFLRTSLSSLSTLAPGIYIKAACRSRHVVPCSFPLHSPRKTSAQYLSTYHSPASNNTPTTERMLHFSRQHAVGYPTFPGNVEALSMPSSPPEPLQESSPSSSRSPPPPPRSTATTQHPESLPKLEKPKRRQALAACRQCRKRKARVGVPRPKATRP
jgi:hypothetical protein